MSGIVVCPIEHLPPHSDPADGAPAVEPSESLQNVGSTVDNSDTVELVSPAVTAKSKPSDGTYRPYMPDEVVLGALDIILQGPLLQSVQYETRITDGESSFSLMKGLKKAKKYLATFRLANKRFAKLGATRLFKILLIWPMRQMGRGVTDLTVSRFVGAERISKYVTTIVFRFGNVSLSLGEVLVKIVEACKGLETFLLFAVTINFDQLCTMFDHLRLHSSNTLVKFECYLPQEHAHVPYLYCLAFSKLKILAATLSKTQLTIARHILLPLPSESIFVTEKFSFDYLHSLRIGHPFILSPQVRWFSSSLTSLTVDFHPPFEAGAFIMPFLNSCGKQFLSLDFRYVGPLRSDVYKACPNVVDFVLDSNCNPICDTPAGVLLHEKITRVGIRGCALSFWETRDNSMNVFAFLGEFIRKGAYPSLKEMHLLDFDPKAFKYYTWDRQTAWIWLFFMSDYRERGIQLLDSRGKSCNMSELNSLVDYAVEEMVLAELIDGIYERLEDSDSDSSIESESDD